MNRLLLVLLSSGLLFSCKKDTSSSITGPGLSSNSAVHADEVQNIPVDVTLGSWCTPENIYMTGNINLRISQVILPDGTTRVKVHQRFDQIRGVGLTSGLRYMLIGQQMDAVVFTPTTGFRQTSHGKFTWRSPGLGKGTTFVNTIRLLYVVDENGIVQVEESFFGLECK